MSKKEEGLKNAPSLNITERKRAEEALRESEARYRVLVDAGEHMGEAIFLLQDTDKVEAAHLFANKEWVRITGYTAEELGGISFYDVIHPRHRAAVAGRARRRLQEGQDIPGRWEISVITKDGTEVPIEAVGGGAITYHGRLATVGYARDITERKRAEEALQESEENFRRSLDDSPLGVRIFDAAGETLYANRAILDIYGYASIEELKASPAEKRLAPESHAEHLKRREKRLRGGEITPQFEMSIVRKNGEIRHLQVFRKEVLWNGKRRVQSLYQDITERKRMEHDLRERVKELQCLYDIAYIVEGPGITLDELCQGVVNLLPVSWQYPEIACARVTLGHKEFMSDNFKTTEWKQLANINVKGQKEGTVGVYYLEARPELNEGAFLKNERLLIDVIAERLGRIIERKQVEEALKESEEKFRTFMETASDLMHMADKDGNITYVNESMTRTLGYSKEEMIGKHVTQFLSKEVLEKDFKPKWEELITKGEIAFESTWVTKDGKEIYGEQKVVAIYDSDGKYAGSRAIFRDLTERMRMERELQEKNEQLDAQNEELQSQTEELMTQQQEIIEKTGEVERANRLKSEFLANMSHELRTPLNVIIGFSELMVDKVPGKINEEQRQCLSDILDSSHRLLNLVNEVLDLSKVESGKMEFKLENVALTEVIESLTRTMLSVLAPRKQSLDIEIEEGLPAVHVDEGRLEQVLLNLATNSSKFTPDGGKLKIEAIKADNWCQVSVIDNGIGIKEEDQERIFEPFCWLDNPLTKEKSGTGLGLALVETIVEKYGGRIWVESEYGKGSRFTFTLPLATTDSPYSGETGNEREDTNCRR